MKKSKQEPKLPLDFADGRYYAKIRRSGRYFRWEVFEQGDGDPCDFERCVSVENAHRAATLSMDKVNDDEMVSEFLSMSAQNDTPWEHLRNIDWEPYYGAMDDAY